jgi:hypothetical protein
VKLLGIDPRLSGALAVVEMINGVPMLVDAIDMPIAGTGTQRRLDAVGVALHLPGKDKEAARQRALQFFPAAHQLFARRQGHNRAEAALIALAGNRGKP